MQPGTDISTVDLTRTCLRLRNDLTFIPQRYGGRTWVHIEVGATNRFYRVGFTEYVFLSLLDGQTTFAEALAVTARTQEATALTESRAHSLYRWILDEELGRFTETEVAEGRFSAEPKQQKMEQRAGRWNPFWIRIPFGCPDPLLRFLKPALGWMFSAPATVAAVAFFIYTLIRLIAAWDQLALASRQVFAPDNWIWLLLAWVFLKLIHETAHGLVCQRYGGTVRDSGIILAFFAPLAYVDVTSSWAFSSRWQRIHTAVAGIYIELLTAAAATIFWLSASSEQAAHLLYNVMVMASLSTILFNANPLMRFDGYYILSDLLQIPNLSARGSEVLQHTVQRLLVGLDSAAPVETGSRRHTLLAYGIAAACWKVVICTSLIIAASVLFHGAGLALAAVGVVIWVGVPLLKLAGWARQTAATSPLRLVRAGTLSVGAIAALAAFLMWTPVPFGATAPGIVTLPEGSAVRAEVDGFIDELHVTPGQQVAEGDLLATLRNRSLKTEYADLQLNVEQARLHRIAAIDRHAAGDAQVAADMEAALQTRLEELSERIEGLQLRAEVAGQVILRNPTQLHGRYVHEGDEIMMIDGLQPLQLQISVAQQDQPQIQQLSGQSVRIRIGTRPAIHGRLTQITPRATLSLRHPALAAPEGGSLAVTASEDDGEYRLTEHRFEAVVDLPPNVSHSLNAGERGYAVFGSSSSSLAGHVYHAVSDWIDDQVAMASQQPL